MRIAKTCSLLVALAILASPVHIARAGVSVSIGINVPLFPELVPVPGYPVYYDPHGDANYFFYDGAYWVFRDDNWYSSVWYNGPWNVIEPAVVPAFVLRVPVRYYHVPPPYFRGWVADAPPRWGEHWGRGWEDRRRGWDRWDRHAQVRLAPLPVYQREYAGDRYPRDIDRQHALVSQNYRYRPHEAVVREHFPAQRARAVERHEQRVDQHARAVERHGQRVENRELRQQSEQHALQNRQRTWEREHEHQREAAEQRQHHQQREKDRDR